MVVHCSALLNPQFTKVVCSQKLRETNMNELEYIFITVCIYMYVLGTNICMCWHACKTKTI